MLMGCEPSAGPQTVLLRAELKTLDLRHPEADLRINIARALYKFIGISGLVGCVPIGVTNSQGLVQKHGIRCIEGTGDALESKEHAALMDAVGTYAIAYNTALLEYLKSHPVP